MDRRTFLRVSGMGVGVLLVPNWGRPAQGAVSSIPTGDKRALADVALNAAKAKGASYADVRIGRYQDRKSTRLNSSH